MLDEFIKRIERGESVYLHEVEEAFKNEPEAIDFALRLPGGDVREFKMRLKPPGNTKERAFIRDCVHARVYNMISVYGGIALYVRPSKPLYDLVEDIGEVFGEKIDAKKRAGYAKCLNVTDRMNGALGEADFCFHITDETPKMRAESKQSCGADFRKAVKNADSALICGMDIGGTDIKIIGAKNGHIDHIKEYDWNPSSFVSVDGIIDTVMILTRLTRALLSLPDDVPPEISEIAKEALDRETGLDIIERGVEELENYLGEITSLDSIGLSFPDVVVRDKIVGGETHKTKGARDNSPDYESEFARLTKLNEKLASLCREGGRVRLTNDGNMAAFTAAAELAHSDRANDAAYGVFAHTLGTELGAGWVDENGQVPEYPLEVYNCIIDIGDHKAKAYPACDVRSINNNNTGLPGTLQKYAGQNGAFRLAEKFYSENAPELYKELFDEGYLVKTSEGMLVVPVEPVDMRKAFLEHLMCQAERGVKPAQKIFETIGEYIAATWLETQKMLDPKATSRILYGRFVKRSACFALMLKGARRVLPGIVLIPADENLACTPLMRELSESENFGVAQFGQAVGAVYFSTI